MSDSERTWQEVATEMSAEQDPQRMMQLAEEPGLRTSTQRRDPRPISYYGIYPIAVRRPRY
jgi:hypothetical protein